jgi:hypothetical protein
VGTQRANGNGKRVASGKPSLRDRDDRRRYSVLSWIVQSRKTGGSRLRRRYCGLKIVSGTCGSSGNFGHQPHRFGRAGKERPPQSILLPKFDRHKQSSGAQYAGVDQDAGVARAAQGRMAGRTARNFSLSTRAPLEGMQRFVSNSRIEQDCHLP